MQYVKFGFLLPTVLSFSFVARKPGPILVILPRCLWHPLHHRCLCSMEKVTLGLVPFIRQCGVRPRGWSKIDRVTAAFDRLCQAVVTTVHLTSFAAWCSTVALARSDDSPSFFCCAEMWASSKSYPPAVVTFIRTMSFHEIDELIDLLEEALVMLNDWIFEMSPLLDEDRGIFLRTLESATMDMLLLIRAAALSKARGDTARLSNLLEF